LQEENFVKKISDEKILVPFLIQNLEMFVSICSFMGIRAPEGGLSKCEKKISKLTSKTCTEVWSRFYLTREIALNDEFFPDPKVL